LKRKERSLLRGIVLNSLKSYSTPVVFSPNKASAGIPKESLIFAPNQKCRTWGFFKIDIAIH